MRSNLLSKASDLKLGLLRIEQGGFSKGLLPRVNAGFNRMKRDGFELNAWPSCVHQGALGVFALLWALNRLRLRGICVGFRVKGPGFGTLARSVLGIIFTFWVMGFLIYKQKGSFFLPRGTGIKLGGCTLPLGAQTTRDVPRLEKASPRLLGERKVCTEVVT